MKVNDFLHHDHFVIKDTANDNAYLGLQINAWGETELSDLYGDREVLTHRMETDAEIFGGHLTDTPSLVLYI